MPAWIFRLLLWTPVILIPLATSSRTLDPALSVRFCLFSFYLLLASVYLFARKKGEVFHTFSETNKRWLLLFLAYFLVSGVSLFLQSQNPADGIYQWLLIFDLGAAILVFSWLFRSYPGYFDELVKGIVIVGGISSIIGVFQFLFLVLPAGISHASTYLLTATFANKNIFAEVLSLTIPFLVYSLLRLNRNWKIAGGLTLLFTLFLIVASLSRSAWVSLGVASIFTLIIVFFFFRSIISSFRLGRIAAFLAGVAIIIGFALLVYTRFGPTGILQKQVHSLLHPTYGSAKDRLLLWEKTLEICKENPVLGNGLGSWKVDIMKYGNAGLKSADNITFYQRPHNDYLWILSEQGIIALLLFLFLMGWLIRTALAGKSTDETRTWPEQRLVVLSSLLIYCSLSFFAFPRERIEHTILLAALSSVLLAGDKSINPRPERTKVKLWLLMVPVWIVLLASAATAVIRYRSEAFTRKAFEARDQQLWELSLQQLDKAENPLYHFDPTSTPLSWYKGMAWYNLGNKDAALQAFTEAYVLCPYHPHVLNNLATCYVEKGEPGKAIPLYEKAVSLAPFFNEAWINLAAVRFNAKDLEGAYLSIRKADTACKLENYQPFLKVILKTRAAKYFSELNDPELYKYATDIMKDDTWLRNIYVKSVREKRDFNTQLTLDIIWVAKQDKKDTLVKRFQKTLPLVYYEKNK